jgi:hypothetical protein
MVLVAALLVTVGGGLWAPAAEAANCGIDLTNWKLQLPLANTGGRPGVQQITDPEPAASAKSPYFFTDNCGQGLTFRTPINGAHTAGSHYPRSELREVTDDGAEASWSSTVGTHTFTETIAFKELPKGKPDVVGAQIHNAAEDISLLVLRGTQLFVTNGDTVVKLVTDDYQLGTKIQMKWVVSGGVTKAYVDGVQQLSFNRAYTGAFFKAGAYPQANCTNASPCNADNVGETIISKLSVSHSPSLS